MVNIFHFDGKSLVYEPFFHLYEQFFSPKLLAIFAQIHKNENFQKITFSIITSESDDIHEFIIS